MKRRKRRIMAILLAIAMIFTMVDPSIFGGAITVRAEETAEKETGSGWSSDEETYYIKDASDLEYVVTHYTDADDDGPKLRNARFVVTDNINLGTSASNRINIGTDTCPFKNEFDGQGYTISGLKFDELIATNGGLFGIMDEGAIIKNLIIDDAHIRSNHYGGILAAQARNAIIQNVTIKNSSCKIASMGNVVGLITTGGLYGGALVGYADNTRIYNCESRNTSVYVDTTGAIQALGGDGMYMGGLVGWMENGSILEYSRVVGGEVSTEYYVAVGALAANILYAGGLVGHIDGSDTGITQVLDCFSSANVNYDGECYVSVGAGLTGYAGGIAARISGESYKMERCHFAGNLKGSLLNSVLVLPIVVMKDYYLSGIAGQVENSDNIRNCYFNWEKAIDGNEYSGVGGPKVPAIYGESNRGDVTTIGEEQYGNSTFFVDFDFEGTKERTTGNATPFDVPHANKWVIDPANNMPVHGSAVQAEIDFPGAGTISFAATSIQSEQKTNGLSDKSSDLANGTTITQIAQTHAEMNEELTLTATVEPRYNFEGWYLRRDGGETAIPVEQYGSQEENYKLVLGGDSESNYEYKDGDVFVAKYTANVLFRNIDDTDNYNSMKCTYQQVINPSRVEIESTGYIFLGWTQTKPTGELDKDQLTTINIDKTGIIEDTISVTTPITLYPVFISIGNYNVQVQMESALLQEDGNKGRIGTEGTAVVKVDEDGNLFISVEDINVKEEEGYHFDGWYKLELDENGTMQTDENGKAKGELVSRSQTYSLKNIDLNNKYRYEARYKYRVKTYVPVRATDGYLKYDENEGYIGDYYVSYGTNINDKNVKQIPDPILNSEEVLFTYWNDKPLKESSPGLGTSWKDLKEEALKEAPEIKITTPKNIYAVIYWNPENKESFYHSIVAGTDFPAGTVKMGITGYDHNGVLDSKGTVKIALQLNQGYNFNGIWQYYIPRSGINPKWDIRASGHNLDCVGKLDEWESYEIPSYKGDTRILARVTANIVLHTDKDNPETTETVTRKYNSRLFNYTNGDEIYNSTENWDKESDKISDPIYKVTDDVLNPIGTGETPKDMDMYKDGYKFLGWTDNAEIFNVEGDDHYVTTDLSSVDAYILDDAVRVTEKMELYPVYVKYDIHTYTSFSKSTLASTNQPEKPDYVAKDNGTVTLNLKQIPKDFESNERYVFKDWRVESEDNNAKVESKENEYILEADYSEKYDIYAEYTAIVSFKNATGENSDINKEYEYDEEIGELPITQLPVGSKVTIKPGESINGDKDVFVGWKDLIISDNSPQNDGKINCPQTDVAKYSFISKDKKIEGAINLWPVYTRPSISLESNVNINDDQQATITISENGAVTLNAPKQDGYVFTGWSLNGESFAETDTYTLSPEQLRSDKEYKFTANYDIVVTYMIPNVSDDNKLTEDYTPMEASIPEGEKIGDGQYSVAPTIAAMSALEKAGYMFGGWALKDGTTEYISEITEPITLYPLTNQAKLSVYSNIDDTTTTLTVNQNQKDGMITFPTEPAELAESKSKLPTGVTPQSEVVSSFIGYSLVEITRNEKKEEISRTSKALYKAGDTISAKDLSAYNGTGNYRIYAVWSQIQNIPNGSIYKDEENDRKGLITAAAVNTKILANAGLKNNESKYERRILYSKGSQYMDIATDETAWNNTLYKDYFDNSYNTDDANWDIYVSFLYNIANPTDEYGVCPYLKFSYSNNKVGNFRDKTNPTHKHSLKTVASDLWNKPDKASYYWFNNPDYLELIKNYAGIE